MVITLGDAITAVPQLGISCSSILTDPYVPGSGMKLMRLISKQLRTAMLGVVQGYTLNLNGKAVTLMDEMALLQKAELIRLCVRVTHGSEGELAGMCSAKLWHVNLETTKKWTVAMCLNFSMHASHRLDGTFLDHPCTHE